MAAVRAECLHGLLDTLAGFGALQAGGMNRQALAAEDFEARAWPTGEAQRTGCRMDGCLRQSVHPPRRPGGSAAR
ncbi:hypothetical protein [Pseudomonas aeruginosa]|uniref:hypothetical protein n=1 Tax=Pseudomonas aeruginosa TaxID=287 RepID=UPI003C2B6A21